MRKGEEKTENMMKPKEQINAGKFDATNDYPKKGKGQKLKIQKPPKGEHRYMKEQEELDDIYAYTYRAIDGSCQSLIKECIQHGLNYLYTTRQQAGGQKTLRKDRRKN